MIVFNCPKCGKEFKSKDEYAGRQFTCTNCNEAYRIPTPKSIRKPPVTAAVDSVPTNGDTPPVPDKLAEASSKPHEEPTGESSVPTEESAEAQSGVKPKHLVLTGLGIALLPLLPLFAGYDESVVAGWTFLCESAAVIILFVAHNRKDQVQPPTDAFAILEDENAKWLASQTLKLRGNHGDIVSVEGGAIRLVKVNISLRGRPPRERSLPIRNISSVEVKKPDTKAVFVNYGFIQFSIAGGAVRDGSLTLTGGAWDAAQDENSVIFVGQSAYQTALKIKEYVETYQQGSSAPSSPVSVADEIVKLKALMDQGIITPEEFAIKKRRFIES